MFSIHISYISFQVAIYTIHWLKLNENSLECFPSTSRPLIDCQRLDLLKELLQSSSN